MRVWLACLGYFTLRVEVSTFINYRMYQTEHCLLYGLKCQWVEVSGYENSNTFTKDLKVVILILRYTYLKFDSCVLN